MSLILNLQTWPGDQEQGMALARLMADIEPEPRDDVAFLFTFRFDSKPDYETVDYVRSKFRRTYIHKTTRQGIGWPQGPNAMFADSYSYCIENTRNGFIKNIDGVMFMESDDVPLDMNWINHINTEWEECKRAGKQILGAWLAHGDAGCEHINGNCIIHIDFWRNNKGILNPRSGGWDADFKNIIIPVGYPSKLIWSDYGLGKPDYNPWKGCNHLFSPKRYGSPHNKLFGKDINPVFLHGPKDLRGIDCVRDKLGLKPRKP